MSSHVQIIDGEAIHQRLAIQGRRLAVGPTHPPAGTTGIAEFPRAPGPEVLLRLAP
jgi:hypothetical protein